MQSHLHPEEMNEPLLKENPDRFCMFPIKNQEIWEFYKKAEASFWTGAEPSAARATREASSFVRRYGAPWGSIYLWRRCVASFEENIDRGGFISPMV